MRLCIFLTIGLLAGIAAAGDALPRQTQTLTVDGERWSLKLPAGMQLELLTDRLDAPRLMTFLPNGELLIGSRAGNVYRLTPPYTDPEVLVELADYPHSLAWRDNELLIAQTDGLYRAPYTPGQAAIPW
ncbi:MAG: hypothetical protein OEX75_09135, partial [Gammaproteobacteria bacterium]|nr:hypothetical protein [Gammaproteobacteria bacterium]